MILTLAAQGDAIKWVLADHLHLTLKFLGWVTQEKPNPVKRFLEELTAQTKSFVVHFAGLGVFPSLGDPRVLWVGVDKGGDSMQNLAERIEKGLERFGFPPEGRPFSAHLTLGRQKEGSRCPPDLKTKLKETRFFSAHEFCADHLTLYRSTLAPGGPIYEPLGVYAFTLDNLRRLG